MRKFFLLLKVLLITSQDSLANAGFGLQTNVKKEGSFLQRIGFGQNNPVRKKSSLIVQLLIFAALTTYFGILSNSSFQSAYLAGQSGQSLLLLSTITSALILVFGVPLLVPLLFYAKDLDTLLPMPIPTTTLIQAKLWQGIIMISSTVLFVVGPFISAGIAFFAPWQFYVKLVIGLLASTFIPAFLLNLIALILFAKTKLFRNKDRFQLFTMLLIMVVALIFGFMSGYMSGPSSTSDLSAAQYVPGIPQTEISFSPYYWILPSIPLLQMSLSQTGLPAALALLALIALAVTLGALLTVLAHHLYLPAVQRVNGHSASGRTRVIVDKDYRSHGKVKSLILRELHLILRTPTYMTQLLFPMALGPLMIIAGLAFGIYKISTQIGLMKAWHMAGEIRASLQGDSLPFVATLGVLVPIVLVFYLAATSMASSTAINRQGAQFATLRLAPLTAQQLMMGLITPGLLFLSPILLILYLILLVVGILPWSVFFMSLASGLLCLIMTQLIHLALNLRWHKLDWTNEMAAVKNAMAPTLGSLLFFGIGLGGGGLIYKLAVNYPSNALWEGLWAGALAPIVLVILLALTLLSYWICIRLAERILKKDLLV